MKKILTIFSIALMIFSCEEFSDGIYDGPDQVAFARTAASGLYLEEVAIGDSDLDSLEVQLIGAQRSTETIVSFELDATANQAIEGVHIDFVTTGGTMTIPANASSGYIYFNVISDNFSITDNIRLVVNLTSDDIKVAGNFSQITKSLAITCESNLAGTYTVSTQASGANADICGDGADYGARASIDGGTVTLTSDGSISGYVISADAGFGAFVEYYGGCGYSSGLTSSEDLDLVDVCGDISGTMRSAYNNLDVIAAPISLTGSYDGSGVITINWTDHFGSVNVTTLTPQ